MLDYTSLFALAAVVREGSFERAARALHVTPSAVSQRIRLLEERVGGALVVRGQPCSPTDLGRRLCQHVDRVRLLEHDLRDDLPLDLEAQFARVSVPVAVNADSLATWFMPTLHAFASEANVLVQLAVDDEGHTADWLRRGQVVAAVTADASPVAGCNALCLGAMPYLAVASPDFVQRWFADGVTLQALAVAPSLAFNAKDRLQQRWVQQALGQALPLPCHTIPSTHAFVAATLAGLGWALNPRALVADHVAQGRLVELVPSTSLGVPLYWQQARVASALLAGLTRHVMAQAQRALVDGGAAHLELLSSPP